MTRRLLAIIVAGGLVFACLPELSALKTASADAGNDADTDAGVISACGDGFVDDDAGESCDPGESVTTTCTSCKIDCPNGTIDTETGHCYFVAGAEAVTYQQAIALCSGGHVVTIDGDREAAFVDALSPSSPYWVGVTYQQTIGAYRAEVTTEPGFSTDAGCPGCYVRALASSDAGTACVISGDGGWTLSSCTAVTAVAICEREPLGQRSFYCQGPYCSTVTFTRGDKRYLLYLDNAARTASDAATECARYEEGKLVVFDSREEREQVVQEVLRLLGADQTSFTAWIGVANDGGTWAWDDGTVVDDGGRPSPWGANQPNTNAGRAFIRIGPAFFDSQLAQTGDDVARPFICQRK